MLNAIAVAMVYSGLVGTVVGVCSTIKPWRFIGIRARGVALVVLAVSMIDTAAGFLMPAPLERTTGIRSDLDHVMPAWQFAERHRVHVQAPPADVYRAIGQVTADEIALFRTLTWIRSPHFGAADESILNPAGTAPIIDVAERSGFVRLSDRAPHEIVLGTRLAPRVKAAINFRVEPAADGTAELTTETRVFAEDVHAAQLFAAYWRLIYPGSALIRVMWLRAIRSRAQSRMSVVSVCLPDPPSLAPPSASFGVAGPPGPLDPRDLPDTRDPICT
jgi:hypothetical protein